MIVYYTGSIFKYRVCPIHGYTKFFFHSYWIQVQLAVACRGPFWYLVRSGWCENPTSYFGVIYGWVYLTIPTVTMWLFPARFVQKNGMGKKTAGLSDHGIPPFFASILTPNSSRFFKTSTRRAKLKEQNHLECQIKSVQFKPPSHANHAQLTKTERWLKLSRLLGKDTPSRLWLNSKPNVKVWRLLGRVTCSRLWSKSLPNVKVWRLLGRITRSRLWSKSLPNVKVWRLLGRVTPSRLWLNRYPNVKVWRLLGRVTPSRLWLNRYPNVKVWRLLGRITPSRLWSNA